MSALHNSGINDIFTILNTAWPLSVGLGVAGQIGSWDALTAKGTDVPSSSTLVLTTATGPRIDISGTTTITAVTLAAGTMRFARATGIFTMTASANLIVNKSTSVNYTTAVGDILIFQADAGVVSVTVIGSAAFPDQATVTYTYTDAGATVGPNFDLYRNSATPAANDIIGSIARNGMDSGAAKQEYAAEEGVIVSPTAGAERGALNFYTTQNGGRNLSLAIGVGGTAFITSAAGTTTLTKLSARKQVVTGSTTQTIVLPAVSELFIGQEFVIENLSTGLVTVQSSGANTIQIMGGTLITYAPGAPGTMLTLTCNSNSGTGTASWNFKYDTPTTNLIAYAPTFTGFGTAANVNFFSRRVGDMIHVRGKFTSGTATAVEARITLGFNGANNNVTMDSTKNASIRVVGTWGLDNTGISSVAPALLAEASVGYMTFGLTNASNAALSKQNGNTLGSSVAVAVDGMFAITGA